MVASVTLAIDRFDDFVGLFSPPAGPILLNPMLIIMHVPIYLCAHTWKTGTNPRQLVAGSDAHSKVVLATGAGHAAGRHRSESILEDVR